MSSRDPVPAGARLAEFARHARTAWRLFKDPRVPLWQKAIPVLGVLYVLSPIDVVPELLAPVLGPLVVADDLAILLLALRAFVHLAPREVVGDLDGSAVGETIDATYRVDDRP